jgi:hypothetical protein
MTIDEAIKLQTELLNLLPEVGFNKYIASTRLGIEALERIGCKHCYCQKAVSGAYYCCMCGKPQEPGVIVIRHE